MHEQLSVRLQTRQRDKCKFCSSRTCYTRIVSRYFVFDEIACCDHVRDLEAYASGFEGAKKHITSSQKIKRGVAA
jgi:hypothetical protein